MSDSGVDLYWLPLGAGGRSVRVNGKVYEAVVASFQRRPRRDLYHSALIVCAHDGRFVIESAPVRRNGGAVRGVVSEGAVGSRWAGCLPIFRYELRCWRDGVIPDVAEAVDSPRRLTDDPEVARRVLDQMPSVPTPVWGRDELRAGDMWNSNSVIAWLITRCGLDVESIAPPAGGRAPGWDAGVVVARRTTGARQPSPDQEAAAKTEQSSTLPPATRAARQRRSDAMPIDRPTIDRPQGDIPFELTVEDLVVGDGEEATRGRKVTVHYVGVAFSTGEEFDASWDRGRPFEFKLGKGQVIKGWDDGVAGMRVGGRRRLTIPSAMAYGARGAGGVIGPHEPLVFVVDLLSVG